MKRVSKLLLLVLGFSAGLLAGAFIRLGFEIINGRPVSIGGEALLLPLVIPGSYTHRTLPTTPYV